MSCADIFLGFIAILFPPIAVWIKRGLCSADSLVNILLCMLGYVPGLIHAWYIIARYPEVDYDYAPIDAESGGQGQRVTYYYVSHEPARRNYGTQGGQQQPKPVAKPKAQQQGQNSSSAAGGRVGGSSAAPALLQEGPSGPSQGAGAEEEGAPPSYSEVVKGDNKIQTRD